MKQVCKCGWTIYNSGPARVACGRCGRISNPQLGDRVERLLSYIGGRQFKRLHRRLFGRDCGCEARKNWLNRLPARMRKKAGKWCSSVSKSLAQVRLTNENINLPPDS